jgi:hypothetical protein
MDLLIWLSNVDMFCILYEHLLGDKRVLKEIRNVENGIFMQGFMFFLMLLVILVV